MRGWSRPLMESMLRSMFLSFVVSFLQLWHKSAAEVIVYYLSLLYAQRSLKTVQVSLAQEMLHIVKLGCTATLSAMWGKTVPANVIWQRIWLVLIFMAKGFLICNSSRLYTQSYNSSEFWVQRGETYAIAHSEWCEIWYFTVVKETSPPN